MRHQAVAVYLLANERRTAIYIGVTGDLVRRIAQHRSGMGSAFVRRYHVTRLVHVEFFESPQLAIAREKQLKAGNRSRKVALIEAVNPEWADLGERYGI